jgi:hypothetical protein
LPDLDILDDPDQLGRYDRSGFLARAAQPYQRYAQARAAAHDWAANTLVDGPLPGPAPIWLDLPLELHAIGQTAAWALSSLSAAPIGFWQPALALFPPAQAGVRLTAASFGSAAAPAAIQTFDLTSYLDANRHPVESVLFLVAVLLLVKGYSLDVEPIASQVEHWLALATKTQNVPAVTLDHNPAKLLARRLDDRLPVFWGDGVCAAIAADWSLRYLWYAELMAFSTSGSELARTFVMARLPRYWPNIAALVQLTLPGEPVQLATAATSIFARRRFVTHTVATLDHLPPLAGALDLLELGEWVALYAATLNNVDPADRVPHQLLF